MRAASCVSVDIWPGPGQLLSPQQKKVRQKSYSISAYPIGSFVVLFWVNVPRRTISWLVAVKRGCCSFAVIPFTAATAEGELTPTSPDQVVDFVAEAVAQCSTICRRPRHPLVAANNVSHNTRMVAGLGEGGKLPWLLRWSVSALQQPSAATAALFAKIRLTWQSCE